MQEVFKKKMVLNSLLVLPLPAPAPSEPSILLLRSGMEQSPLFPCVLTPVSSSYLVCIHVSWAHTP